MLLALGNVDYVMTTNFSKASALRRNGWRDYSNWAYFGASQSAYIHSSRGSGRVKLYRFYGSSSTDHLYTTNFAEGTGCRI